MRDVCRTRLALSSSPIGWAVVMSPALCHHTGSWHRAADYLWYRGDYRVTWSSRQFVSRDPLDTINIRYRCRVLPAGIRVYSGRPSVDRHRSVTLTGRRFPAVMAVGGVWCCDSALYVILLRPPGH